jgi:hypothetical protein
VIAVVLERSGKCRKLRALQLANGHECLAECLHRAAIIGCNHCVERNHFDLSRVVGGNLYTRGQAKEHNRRKSEFLHRNSPKKANKKIGNCGSAFDRRAADLQVTNIVFDTRKVSIEFQPLSLAITCDNT